MTAQLNRSAVRVVKDLVYSEVVGFRPLELDLYLPPGGDSPHPVVVFLHGGGWQRGSRRQTLPVLSDLQPTLFDRIAAAGFAVAAADYRLSGEAVFPAPATDVRVAASWLREHATDLGLDGAPVYLWGESAGAHLALLVAMSDEIGGHDDVAGVVAWFPPTDLLGLDADAEAVGGEPHSRPDSRESRLLGAAVTDVPELARAASPLTHVRSDAPPTLLMHGDADHLVPAQQSIRLADALQRLGAPAQLEIVPGAGHMWIGCADPAAVVERSLFFLRGLRPT